MRGLRAPSTAGCGRAGASSSRTRSGSAPGASCVTMDIWLLAAPSSHSERPPQRQQPGSSASAQVTGWTAAAAVAAAATAAVTGVATAGEREEEEDGERQVLLYPEAASGSLPLTKLFEFSTQEKPQQSSICMDYCHHLSHWRSSSQRWMIGSQ